MNDMELLQRAKLYMDKLAQGIDPVTDQELPEDTVLNQVRMARCFFYVSGVLSQVIDNGGVVSKGDRKQAFCLTAEQKSRIQLSERPLRITELMQLLFDAAGDPDMKKPGSTLVTNWLLEKKLMVKQTDAEGKSVRVPTPAGAGIGIMMERRQGQYGEYTAVYYNQAAQQFIVDHLDEILGG